MALELRRKGCRHSESLHLMRQRPHADAGPLREDEKAGLGARVVHDDRGMKVCDLYDGSSAYWSTLKIDDIICGVDGHDIRHGPPALILQLTNGSVGFSMCVHVIRCESTDDEITGALSARGLSTPGGSQVAVAWKDAKEPELNSGEKLVRVLVVRSRSLADKALKRAMDYRASVVDLLQQRIERVLLEGSEAGPSELNGELQHHQDVGEFSKSHEEQNHSLLPTEPARNRMDRTPSPEWSNASSKTEKWSPSKTPRVLQLEGQLQELQKQQESEMQRLQNQIVGLASVIQHGKDGHYGEGSTRGMHDVQKELLGCMEQMQQQQQEEKKNVIALFQRHSQELTVSQERMAAELHRQIQELRQKDSENVELKQRFHALAEQVENLNLNNVLLGNLPPQYRRPDSIESHQTAARKQVPQLALTDGMSSRGSGSAQTSAHSSNVGSTKIPRDHSDEAVGVSVTIQANFDRVKKHEKRFSDDLVSAFAWCLQASEVRFVYSHIERGSVVAKLNVVPDPSGADPRSCRALAEELAAQSLHPHSPMRKAPVTKPATKVEIHEAIAVGGNARGSASMELLPTLGEIDVDAYRNTRQVPVMGSFNSTEEKEDGLLQTAWTRADDEMISDAEAQELSAEMKRRIQEMSAFVSQVAELHDVPVVDLTSPRNDGKVAHGDDTVKTGDGTDKDEVSYHFPPRHSPLKSSSKSPPSFVRTPRCSSMLGGPPLQSVLDLSSDTPAHTTYSEAGIEAQNFSQNTLPFSQAAPQQSREPSAETRDKSSYRRLPPASALELDAVISRLELSHAGSPGVPQARQRRDLSVSSRNGTHLDDIHNITTDGTNRSRLFVHSTNDFIRSLSPDQGVLSPGSGTSVNMSRASSVVGEPKRWRVLPQWPKSQAEQSVINPGKGTPRDTPRSLPTGTPRSHADPDRGQGRPQHSGWSVGRAASPRGQYVPSETSAGSTAASHHDDYGHQTTDAGGSSQMLPSMVTWSPPRSPTHAHSASALRQAKAAFDESDSDDDVRVRAVDLPLRRLHQRFQK